MGIIQPANNNQTSLDQDDMDGLLIKTISTREELNEAEQLNIHNAVKWTMSKKFTSEEVMSENFVRQLHKRMYGDVWKWAGKYRTTDKNIGVDKYQVQVEMAKLLQDTLFWMQHKTFDPDEIAVRFKHRIVSIHCFPNGNGRHSRLMADVIVSRVYDHEAFLWGSGNVTDGGTAREKYLQALRDADRHDITALLKFARSGR